jgi:hypothetical protein
LKKLDTNFFTFCTPVVFFLYLLLTAILTERPRLNTKSLASFSICVKSRASRVRPPVHTISPLTKCSDNGVSYSSLAEVSDEAEELEEEMILIPSMSVQYS